MSYRGIFVLTLAMVTYTKANSIFVIDGGNFGIWGPEERCPGTEKAIGFKIKVEPNQGKNGDDTALNAIGLKCSGGSWIYSTQGPWGDWNAPKQCKNGSLAAFQLRVEKLPFEIGDDTKANDINFWCTVRETLYGNSTTSWGDWTSWSNGCPDGIRGLRTRVEAPQGSGDDTALNNVEFFCS